MVRTGFQPRCFWSKNHALNQFSAYFLTALAQEICLLLPQWKTIFITHSICSSGAPYPFLPHDKEKEIGVEGILSWAMKQWRLEFVYTVGSAAWDYLLKGTAKPHPYSGCTTLQSLQSSWGFLAILSKTRSSPITCYLSHSASPSPFSTT